MDGARHYEPGADDKIIAWRTLCFMHLGFMETPATALAMRRDIDRVAVQNLRRRGCTPKLVLEILL